MTRLHVMTGVLGLALAGVVAAKTPQQLPVFRSATSAVRVDVGVRDASRRVVEGLKAADFTVLDNGVEQKVEDVSFGKVPIDVTIALDVSRSVAGPLLDRLRVGVMQLARDLRKEDRLRLLVFNLETQRLVDFTGDIKAMERAMQAATAGGGTALFDALSIAMLSAAPDTDRRQLIVCFTDGQDGNSTTSAEALHAVTERTRATVSFVVLPAVSTIGAPVGPPVRSMYTTMPGPQNLIIHPAVQKLAAETGGQIIPAMQSTNLGPMFLQALDLFRATYVLHFTPKGVAADGFHTLSVAVNRPGVSVQARRGYFGR